MFHYSKFGNNFFEVSGISELMKDLGTGLEKKHISEIYMLGGGNPSHIKSVESEFHKILKTLSLSSKTIPNLLGEYTHPLGKEDVREMLAKYLSKKLKHTLSTRNIAITNGSQSAFYVLLNSFSGYSNKKKDYKILFPMAPEYIGYSRIAIQPNQFVSIPPIVKKINDYEFEYLPDFKQIITRLKRKDIGAICLSNPSNPTGNVLSEENYKRLNKISEEHNVPLIIDSAYGYPFPNIIYNNEKLFWTPNTVLVLSLSKIGLPGVRTGIVVASESIVQLIQEANSILQLAPSNLGQYFLMELLKDNKMEYLIQEYILPFYKNQRDQTLKFIHSYFQKNKVPFIYHKNHGAFFIWLGFPKSKLTSMDIYKKAKKKNLFIVPGEWFFYGLGKKFNQSKNFIRLTFSRNLKEIEKGIDILAKIIK